MSDVNPFVVIIVALIGVAGGASVATLITVIANRRVTGAEADSLVVTSADTLLTRQQDQLDRADADRLKLERRIDKLGEDHRVEMSEVRKKLMVLEDERIELMKMAARFRPIEGLLTMAEFVERGWLADLNARVAHPRGLHIAIYNDDVDETVTLGHIVYAKEQVPLTRIPSEQEMSDKSTLLDEYAARFRDEAGLPPIGADPDIGNAAVPDD